MLLKGQEIGPPETGVGLWAVGGLSYVKTFMNWSSLDSIDYSVDPNENFSQANATRTTGMEKKKLRVEQEFQNLNQLKKGTWR